jgi:hypothetical protein
MRGGERPGSPSRDGAEEPCPAKPAGCRRSATVAWSDARLYRCPAHGGPEARETALKARRQSAIRRLLNADAGPRARVVARGALSAAIPAECDLAAADYAGSEGY